MASAKTDLLVSAAASLTDVFEMISRAFERSEQKRVTVRCNFAASGVLKQQILAGAPVDVFAAAAPKEMDELQAAKRIVRTTRINFTRNRLVLIVPVTSRLAVRGWESLARPEVGRIALANPESVPAGRYGRETLMKRRLWDLLQPKLVFGENVRQTLTYVVGGDVDAGIVFSTDARSEAKCVRVAAMAIPGKDHAPIVYPAAVIAGSPQPDTARRFIRFLKGDESQTLLRRFGFS
jgi:molybdate transport system substrate-binding protein